MGAPGRPLQGDEILKHKLEERESVRWIFGKTKAQVERAAVQRPWGRNVLAVFQAQDGWVEQRAGIWVRDTAGKPGHEDIGPRVGR